MFCQWIWFYAAMSVPPTQWHKLDVTWRLSLWHDNCDKITVNKKRRSCEQWALLCHIAKIQMDLWPFFFFNTTQKSLATVDIDAYMGWCIWNIHQFKSLKKNVIAFSKSISCVFVDDLVHIRNGPRWQWHIRCQNCVSWPLEKLIFYACGKKLRTKSFCMKRVIQVFFSRCITEFTLQLRYDETNQINRAISQIPQCTNSISHNTPFRIEMYTFLFHIVHCGI